MVCSYVVPSYLGCYKGTNMVHKIRSLYHTVKKGWTLSIATIFLSVDAREAIFVYQSTPPPLTFASLYGCVFKVPSGCNIYIYLRREINIVALKEVANVSSVIVNWVSLRAPLNQHHHHQPVSEYCSWQISSQPQISYRGHFNSIYSVVTL